MSELTRETLSEFDNVWLDLWRGTSTLGDRCQGQTRLLQWMIEHEPVVDAIIAAARKGLETDRILREAHPEPYPTGDASAEPHILDELWHHLVDLKSSFGVQAASEIFCFARDHGIKVGPPPASDTEKMGEDDIFKGQFLYNPYPASPSPSKEAHIAQREASEAWAHGSQWTHAQEPLDGAGLIERLKRGIPVRNRHHNDDYLTVANGEWDKAKRERKEAADALARLQAENERLNTNWEGAEHEAGESRATIALLRTALEQIACEDNPTISYADSWEAGQAIAEAALKASEAE